MGFAMVGIALLLVFLGWGVDKKKWYFLISGYNMMSPEEQQKVDVKSLAKSIAKMMYVIAGLMLLMGVFSFLELWTPLLITTLLIIVVPFAMMFKHRKYQQVGQSKKTKVITGIITGITVIGVGVLVFLSLQPTKYVVTGTDFTIEGMYGETIKRSDMVSIQLVDELPEIAIRANGSSIGSKHKGIYKLEDGDKVKLFVDEAKPPFIEVKTPARTFYLNETDAAKTNALFEQLQ